MAPIGVRFFDIIGTLAARQIPALLLERIIRHISRARVLGYHVVQINARRHLGRLGDAIFAEFRTR
jgi:hypothetical protein